MVRIAAGFALLVWAYAMGFIAWQPLGPAAMAVLLAMGASAVAFIGHQWRSASAPRGARTERRRELAIQAGKAAAIWAAGYFLFWIGVIAGFSVGI